MIDLVIKHLFTKNDRKKFVSSFMNITPESQGPIEINCDIGDNNLIVPFPPQ